MSRFGRGLTQSWVGASLTELWNTHLSPLFSDLVAVGGDAINAIAAVIKALWDNVIDPLANWLLSTFGPVFTRKVFNSILGIVTHVGVADVLDVGLIYLLTWSAHAQRVSRAIGRPPGRSGPGRVSDISGMSSATASGAASMALSAPHGTE